MRTGASVVVASAIASAIGLGVCAGACALTLAGTAADGGAEPTGDGASFDGGADRATVPDGSDPADAGDEAGDADVDVNGEASCPTGRGPAMVRVAYDGVSYCIDATEVTSAQFEGFLASNPTPSSAECQWKTVFGPDGGAVAPTAFPVLADWCDAYEYCKWAGKHLCSKLGGGTLGYGPDVDNWKKCEWMAACTNGGTTKYPYGDAFDATKCPGLHPVGALPDCQGPAGVFDLSANLWEWIDACQGAGQNADCAIRGGSSVDIPANQACAEGFTGKRSEIPYGATGFRCCAP